MDITKEQPKLTKEQQQWVDALKSGNYLQSESYLKSYCDGDTYYCCLGVATEMFDPEDAGLSLNNVTEDGSAKRSLGDKASDTTVRTLHLKGSFGGFNSDEYEGSLAQMNDRGHTFEQIAEFIEQNPEAVFTKGAE